MNAWIRLIRHLRFTGRQSVRTSRISYGGTAAVVTSTALVSGLGAANATTSVIVSALLVAALADNLTDALSIHIFQESEQLDQREAFTGTVTNFFARFLLCASFAILVGLFPQAVAARAAIAWGAVLLAALTYLVARERRVNPWLEIVKHLIVASAVILASTAIGHWVSAVFG